MRSRRTARFKSLFEELPAFDDALVWYWIGPRAEYDRLISQFN
jgi:hypothetical protein